MNLFGEWFWFLTEYTNLHKWFRALETCSLPSVYVYFEYEVIFIYSVGNFLRNNMPSYIPKMSFAYCLLLLCPAFKPLTCIISIIVVPGVAASYTNSVIFNIYPWREVFKKRKHVRLGGSYTSDVPKC